MSEQQQQQHSTRALPSPPSDIKQENDYITNNSDEIKTKTLINSKKKETATNTNNNNKSSLIQPLSTNNNNISTSIASSSSSSTASTSLSRTSNNSHKRTLSDTIASLPPKKYDIIHDPHYCMFKIQLDSEGNSAALCYLPTRYKNIIEFYHVEIPVAYRNQGFGDILLYKAFQWVEKSNIMVIPTCPFVLKYLESTFLPPERKNLPSCIFKK